MRVDDNPITKSTHRGSICSDAPICLSSFSEKEVPPRENVQQHKYNKLVHCLLTALPPSRFWREFEARLRRNLLLASNGKTVAKQQYCPLEAETTLNLLSDCPPFYVYPIRKYWCNLMNSRGLYSSIINLKVKYLHGRNRLYLSSKSMMITITKSNKLCAAIVYLYCLAIGTSIASLLQKLD